MILTVSGKTFLVPKTKSKITKSPDKINGTAKPNEYNDNKIIALISVSSMAAKVKIDPKIGPIQGVQPNPKASPIR